MKPRLLDLFCGAGGAAMGYHRAGFEVVGVDIEPQLNYPFEFIQADALEFLSDEMDHLRRRYWNAIHASPPCQAHSKAQRINGKDHPDLIAQTRDLLKATGLPWVIENVPGAPLRADLLLCGTMFELPLYRHRVFEVIFPCTEPLHGEHHLKQVKMGRPVGPNEIIQPVGNFSGVEHARVAMDTPWMTRDEMREAIPPAYTEHIGSYLLAEVKRLEAAHV